MKRSLDQVQSLAVQYQVPILCAGDLFDHWKAPPELINFALVHLPDEMIAIPGQHDLPHHRMEDLHRSAFQTLVEAGKIKRVGSEGISLTLKRNSFTTESLDLYGFAWGQEITKPAPTGQGLRVALVHRYIWVKGHSYPNAPKDSRAGRSRKELTGYDVAIFGDNHLGFSWKLGSTQVFNCGSLMRRASDEISYRPQVGLIHLSGKVTRIHLDISQDSLQATKTKAEGTPDLELTEFLEELQQLAGTPLDFTEAMKQTLAKKKPRREVRDLILKAMDNAQ